MTFKKKPLSLHSFHLIHTIKCTELKPLDIPIYTAIVTLYSTHFVAFLTDDAISKRKQNLSNMCTSQTIKM